MNRRLLPALMLPSLALACTRSAPTEAERLSAWASLPQHAQAPDDGAAERNTVIPIDFDQQVTCANGSRLNLNIRGRVQTGDSPGGGPGADASHFHLVYTYTNASGQSFVWRSNVLQRITTENGQGVIILTGRGEAQDGHTGRLVLDGSGQVVLFSAGRADGDPTQQACDALT